MNLLRTTCSLSTLVLIAVCWRGLAQHGSDDDETKGELMLPFAVATLRLDKLDGKPTLFEAEVIEGAQPSNLCLYVFDTRGNCIAWQDNEGEPTRRTVQWAPTADEPSFVEFHNLSANQQIVAFGLRQKSQELPE